MEIGEKARGIEPSLIRKMFDRLSRVKEPVNLGIGMPDFETPKPVRDALIGAVEKGWNSYTTTQGLPELRERIARKLRDEHGVPAQAERIIVTSGASGALDLAFRALLDPGDEVIIPEPYFAMYKELARLCDAVPVFVDTYPDFQLTAERIRPHITPRTRLLIVNTPNNPTGAVYPAEELERIARLAREHGIAIVSDEVYERFVYEGAHASIGRFHEDTITVGGFSKSLGITGWRIGYAAGPKEAIDAMCTLQQHTYVCAPSIVQHGVLEAFGADIREAVARYDKNRMRIVERLSRHYSVGTPQGAFYALVGVQGTGTRFAERMIERGLFVVPGNAFSSRDTHVRLSYGVAQDVLERGLRIMEEAAEEESGGGDGK